MADRRSHDTLMETASRPPQGTVNRDHSRNTDTERKITTMHAERQSMQTASMNHLDSMTFSDLETMKRQLDTVRRRILQLQNAQSLLFRLPGELRNKIFLLAMYAELEHRRGISRHNYSTLFIQPAFFRTSRQIYEECFGVWYNDILVWEEFFAESKEWKPLKMAEVRALCQAKDKSKVVTQLAHCDLGRTRDSVEGSRSICPRKGLVRVKNESLVLPQLRWWVW